MELSIAVVVPAFSASPIGLPTSPAFLLKLPPSAPHPIPGPDDLAHSHSLLASFPVLAGFSEVVGEAASPSPQKML